MMAWDPANALDRLFKVYLLPLVREEVASEALLLVTTLRARMVLAVAATALAVLRAASSNRFARSLSRCPSLLHNNLAGRRPRPTAICATANEHLFVPTDDVDGVCRRADGSKRNDHNDDHDKKSQHIIIGSERVFIGAASASSVFPCFIYVREWVPRGIFDESLTNSLLLPGTERNGWNEKKHSTLFYITTIITTKISQRRRRTVIHLTGVHSFIYTLLFQSLLPPRQPQTLSLASQSTASATICQPRVETHLQYRQRKRAKAPFRKDPSSFGQIATGRAGKFL